MVETEGIILCPACGIALNEFVYRLIELHPHETSEHIPSASPTGAPPEVLSAAVTPTPYDNRYASQRNRTANAIAVWTLLPLALAGVASSHCDFTAGSLLTLAAIVSILAAIFGRSSSLNRQTIAVLLLVVLALPFVILFIQRLALARGTRFSEVADSPSGYLTGAIGELLFFVPLIGFAQALYRRRSGRHTILE